MVEEIKLSLFQKFLKLLIIPTIVANLIKMLTMDESGWSLKKFLSIFATFEAAKMSHEVIAKDTFTMFAGMMIIGFWLIYGGILVGIYSFGDIANGIKSIKENENKSPQ